jgi:hypothetical protein
MYFSMPCNICMSYSSCITWTTSVWSTVLLQLKIWYACLQLYNRMEYAGVILRTWKSQKENKHDDARLVMDYAPPRKSEIKRAYARIKRLFVHQAYPGGPSRFMVEGSRYDVVGTCSVTKTTLIRRNRANPFNTSSRYAFLDNCSERPVAVWPRDPFGKLPVGHPEKKWFHVIDRNQSVLYDWQFLGSPDPIDWEQENMRATDRHRGTKSESENLSCVWQHIMYAVRGIVCCIL